VRWLIVAILLGTLILLARTPEADEEEAMKAFSKILVPVDFSQYADAAIDTAIEMASRYDASITLINVFEPLALAFPHEPSFYAGPITADVMEDLRKALDKKKSVALAKGAKHVDVAQSHGNPFAAIKDFAEAGEYDLIVMGTRGRTGLAHFFVGSVAERVVQTASCAVLTVQEKSRPLSKILVPTDFSSGADAAIDAAIDLAARWQASITLVHVFEPIAYAFPMGTGIYSSLPVDHVVKDQLEALDRLRHSALAKGAEQVEIVQRTGHPPTEIRDLARAGDFDLIAMGTHGRSGLSHMLIGSVAERVVRLAPCAVLTIREAPPTA
jgi:nucleotide-binding universal stress UspA family protein